MTGILAHPGKNQDDECWFLSSSILPSIWRISVTTTFPSHLVLLRHIHVFHTNTCTPRYICILQIDLLTVISTYMHTLTHTYTLIYIYKYSTYICTCICMFTFNVILTREVTDPFTQFKSEIKATDKWITSYFLMEEQLFDIYLSVFHT